MDLYNAKLDEVYKFYIDPNSLMISVFKTPKTITATVIATKKPEYGSGVILGWKADQPKPVNSTPRNNTSIENVYSTNEKLYTWGLSVQRITLVESKVVISLNGYNCKKCNNHYPYSEPNQPDGTLICWSCRHY